MKSLAIPAFLTRLVLLLLLLSSFAAAQQRSNSLAVNGELHETAGPYYFIDQGDSVTAFARASEFAKALGLSLTWQENTKTLVFRQGLKAVSLQTTSDVRAGLEKRSGVLTSTGLDISSPLGIVVNGTSFVAIDPLASAFGLETGWHAEPRLLTVDAPAPEPVVTATAPTSASPAAGGPSPGPVRVGIHDDYARVALDLGSSSNFDVAVTGNLLTATFSTGNPGQATRWPDNPFVRSAAYAVVNDQLTLIVETHHALDAAGRGFRHGLTDSGTLYFDFAPTLQGRPVTELNDTSALQAVAPPPAMDYVSPPATVSQNRRTVILDPGHGGRDPGAQGVVSEAEVVLDVSLRLKRLLEAQGIEVLLTRDDNHHLDANKASDLALRANMATPDRMMFVSIHANSVDVRNSHKAEGIETWVFGEPLDPRNLERAVEENGGGELGRALTAEAVRAANDPTTLILRETQLNYSLKLARAVQANLVSATGAIDRGVKQNAWYVIKNARTPSILVELGFVGHPTEGRKLSEAAYRDTLARALHAGIMEFINNGGTVARND